MTIQCVKGCEAYALKAKLAELEARCAKTEAELCDRKDNQDRYMTTEDPIEAAAKAAFNSNCHPAITSWDRTDDMTREYWRQTIQAAIKAYGDTHAELRERHDAFVRRIREQADDERFTDAYSINRIVALCDAELKGDAQ